MRFKTKILLIATLSLFCLSAYTTVPTVAFAADSYQNQVGEEMIWDIRAAPSGWYLYGNIEVNDQLKMVVTTVNQTIQGSTLHDCIYAMFYRKRANESTWSPWVPSERLIAAYHESTGIYVLFGPIYLILVVVPHNVTAIIKYIHNLAIAASGSYDWMDGEYGYDGYGGYWSNDITSPGAIKVSMQFNDNATVYILKLYNSTGTKWVMQFHMEIYIPPPIPGFTMTSVAFILTIFVAVYVLKLKRKPDIMI